MNTDIVIFGNTFSIWSILIICVIIYVMFVNIFVGCCTDHPINVLSRIVKGFNDVMNNRMLEYQLNPIAGFREGFTNNGVLNTSNYETLNQNLAQSPSPQSWGQQSLTIDGTNPPSQAVVEILNRPKQPLPLKEGEMDFFANTKFSPSCCPNSYSNSQGCACMDVGSYNYLINRGGNNVPYSEY